MSEEMAPSGSWRSLASAASRSIKGYVAQQRELKKGFPASRSPYPLPPDPETPGKRQTWSQWAGQKLRRGSQSEYDTTGDRIALFPGWATRRYREPSKGGDEETPFDIDVFVSGYAYKFTGIGFNTRAGKAFLRLAKSFAALPKLPASSGLSRSTEELLASKRLPPLPDEITDESEMEALDDHLRRLDFDARSVDSGRGLDTLSMASSESNGARTPSSASSYAGHSPPSSYGSTILPTLPGASPDLQRWHANLEARLHPFWSSVLSNRALRISLYAADPSLYDSDGAQTDESGSSEYGAPDKQSIVTREVITAADGSFQLKFSVPWEQLCVHPGALHIAFGGFELEQDMFVTADLLAPPSPGPSTPTGSQLLPQQTRAFPLPVSVSAAIHIPLSHASVRVISDIDDTVKLSGILGGARAVFHNVFVKDLQDSVVRGMGDWYMGMWRRGVRFHYVSNGPFELLPVVNEFMQISHLPPGSIRLRSYGGRSLFNGLLSAPAMRKRDGVLDVLNHFPDARFFLVGDSGEQDLELYSDIARERPDQILGIFIRDACVRRTDAAPPLDDPTGARAYTQALRAGLMPPGSSPAAQINGSGRGRPIQLLGRRTKLKLPTRSMSDATPTTETPPPPTPKKPSRSYSGADMAAEAPSPAAGAGARARARAGAGPDQPPPYDYFSAAPRAHSPIFEEPESTPGLTVTRDGLRPSPGPGLSTLQAEWRETSSRWQLTPPQTPLSDAEKKRAELQVRLWKMRLLVAPQIPIRIFREPEECVEVDEILGRLQVQVPRGQ